MQKSKIGPFALESKLDPNQTGSVMMAIHVERSMPVALKLFPAPLVVKSDFLLYQYVQEFRKLKRLKHPNIAKCYGGGFEGQYGYIAWELIRGRSLKRELDRRGRLAWDAVVDFGEKMASALEYAHDEEILHGNLNLDKILIEKGTEELKMVDFRITHHVDSEYAPMRLPTIRELAFVAPERTESEAKPTVASDIYSLGSILYLMVSGELPIEAKTRSELSKKKKETPPKPVAQTILDCPIWLDALIQQMLDPDPDKRPRTAMAVRMALEETKKNLARGTTVTEHAAGGLSPLQLNTSRSEAKKVLGVVEEKMAVPMTERPWFSFAVFISFLVIMFAGLTWMFWPLSAEQLLDRGVALIETGKPANIRQAEHRFIRPLLQKYPDSPFADRGQGYLDQIEMDRADRQLKVKLRLGKPLSEIERLYVRATRLEEFGDVMSSSAKYSAIVELFDDKDEKLRPVILLAQSRLKNLDQGGATDRLEFLRARMTEADQFLADHRTVDAVVVWQGVVKLYSRVPEAAELVELAKSKLKEHGT